MVGAEWEDMLIMTFTKEKIIGGCWRQWVGCG